MIAHITFTSVFSTTHISLSINFTSALAEQLRDRPLEAPEHPITRSPPATDHATTVAHTQWGDNIQGGPEGQMFPQIITLTPQHERASKPVTIPRNILTDFNGNLHAQRTTDKRTKSYKPGTQPPMNEPNQVITVTTFIT